MDYVIDDPSSPGFSGPRQGKYLPRGKVHDFTLSCRTCFPGDFSIDLLTLLPATKGSETLRSSHRVGQSSPQGLVGSGGEQTLTEHSDSWSSVHWAPGPRTGLGKTHLEELVTRLDQPEMGTVVRCQGPVRISHGSGYKSEKSLVMETPLRKLSWNGTFKAMGPSWKTGEMSTKGGLHGCFTKMNLWCSGNLNASLETNGNIWKCCVRAS